MITLGLALIALSIWQASRLVRRVDGVVAKVRPAMPSEAPSPEHAERTVVGEPDGSPSALAELKVIFAGLVAFGVLAAAGAGLATWGAFMACARRRHTEQDDAAASRDQA